ncbi:hypothetical protein DFH07DRAFT_881102 [Mycena maculata]|uniref:DUF6533 domain-containing protein n=1 Tax=Mycena maculata TaxID=230809 RepID=A0AAD7NMZ3_9AGAR|nr:hypothetical protein DFH07DRAFT_881102 [Mycena maculata]
MPSLNLARQAPPAGAPAPNFGQIPLPPGMTLGEFESLQYHAISISICVAVAFGVVCWDYLVLFRDEIRMYTSSNKQLWKQPATWAFILLRYSAFVATFPALFFTSIQSQHCQAAVIVSQVGAVLVVGSSGIIFCNRVVAIYSNSKVIVGALVLLWGGMMGCWIAVATQYSAVTGPATPFLSNCQMNPIVSWAPISYASSVGFDVIILALTIARLKMGNTGQSAISKQIYNDNLMYFLATAATNITVLSIQALGTSFELIKPTAVPFSTIVTVTMAQRVYLNLKLYHQRNQRAVAGLPASAPSQQTISTGSTAPKHYNAAFVGGPMAGQNRPWDTGYHSRAPSSDVKAPLPSSVFVQREVHAQ